MNISAIIGLVIIPALLLGWVIFDILDSVFRRSYQRKIIDTIREAKRKLQGPSILFENSEFLISTIVDKIDNLFISEEYRPILKHFVWATSQALNSELHQRDIADDPQYTEEIITLFDNTIAALDNSNLKDLVNNVGRLYLIDALDRIPKNNMYISDKAPAWVRSNKDHPFYIVSSVLKQIIDALELQDLYKSKELINHSLDHFSFLGTQATTSLPFLVLKWAENYLNQLSDVRSAGNPLIWLSPEKATLKILKKAQVACEAEDINLIITVISSGKDAYRTPRI